MSATGQRRRVGLVMAGLMLVMLLQRLAEELAESPRAAAPA
jgi:hypothetical protein